MPSETELRQHWGHYRFPRGGTRPFDFAESRIRDAEFSGSDLLWSETMRGRNAGQKGMSSYEPKTSALIGTSGSSSAF